MGVRKTQAEAFFGNAHYVDIIVPYGLNQEIARVWSVKSSTAAAEIGLPDARTVLGTGWPVFFIYITSDSTDPVPLKTRQGVTLKTLAVGTVTSVGLVDGTTEDGEWCVSGTPDPRAYLGIFFGEVAATDPLRRYNPDGGAWETGATFTRDHREWASSFQGTLGSYVVGDTSATTANTDRYAVNTWTARTARPTASHFSPAAFDQDLGYLFGSDFGLSNPGLVTHRYTDTTDTWTARTSVPEGVNHGVVGTVDTGKIIVGLGTGGFGDTGGLIREYDVAGNSYSGLSPHPETDDIYHASSFPLEGRLHQIGGSININQAAQSWHYSYDSGGGAWSQRTNYSAGAVKHGAGTIDEEVEKAYVAAGSNIEDDPTKTFVSYLFDTFKTLQSIPVAFAEIEYQLTSISKP